MDRRSFLGAGGVCLAGLLRPGPVHPGQQAAEVRLFLDRDTGEVGFDPVGLWLEPGMLVRWINGAGVHTVTAYHPDNGNRALRIPQSAQPWDSGHLMEPGAIFERRFTVPGVYDYFCIPHERAGMAGRLVVDTISGPGARPFGWWQDEHDWQPVPRAVQERLPAAEEIARARRASAS